MSNIIEIAHDSDIKTFLEKDIAKCESEILIISAFVKVDVIKWIDKNIEKNLKKELLVRFRKSDILVGATDFELLEYCLSNDWNIKFDLNLHSKIYVFDRNKFLIGSANATNRGLSLTKNANKETMISGKLNKDDYLKINSIFSNAREFNSDLLLKMNEELLSKETLNSNEEDEWSVEISKEPFIAKIQLLKEDLLTSRTIDSLTDNDKFLLNIKTLASKEEIKSNFIKTKIFKWLVQTLTSEPEYTIYFGNLSRLMHSDIAMNDEIFRVNIKEALSILLYWIEELEIKEIILDRPNYSQRIRLIT